MATAAPTQLLERSDQLRRLSECLDDVRNTQAGRLCVIAGEAGVGKTALVRTFLGANAEKVLWGACDPLFTARPLGPFADIADATGGELDRLVHGQGRAHEVASAFLQLLRNGSPAVAVLEDLHWADEATLDVMRLLGRRIESAPGLVIATYRDDQLGRDHPLRAVLGELPRDESIIRMHVRPLSADAVATLARSRRVDPVELYRKTGGNPLFVTEVLASGDEAIPGTVRDAVLARASRLSAPARALLDAVAVSPNQAEVWLLEEVSGSSFQGLGECLDAGMLMRQNGSVGFRHEVARLAVEDSIPPDVALHLHRQTLHALASSQHGEVDPARLAHHAEHAHDPEALLRFGRVAGQRASALGAHREAAAQLARAVAVAGALPPADHGDLLQEFAHESLHVAQVDRSIEAEERAVQLFREAGDPLREAGALRRLARFYSCGVRGAEMREPLDRAIDILEGLPPSNEQAIAVAMVAMFDVDSGKPEAGLEAARRAVLIAEQTNDDEAIVYTLDTLGTLELQQGFRAGREKLLRSLDMAEELGMDEEAGRAFLNLADVSVQARLYDGLLELIRRGIDYSAQHGLELWRLWLLTSEARLHLDHCDFAMAAEVAEMVLRGQRGQLPRIAALPVLGLVRARRGDPHVWPLLDEAKAMSDRDGQPGYAVPIVVARAETAWLEGRHEAVAVETETAYQRVRSLGAWWYLGEMSCWRRRAGIEDDVHPKLAERYAAELRGDFVRAAELWSALGCEYDAAMALAASDDEELLKQSLLKLQRLGARPAAAIVSARLRARGATGIARGPRATTQGNPAMLTDRELEILELVSEGMRNGEIASRLFLAPKTVDHHVSAILRKLDVANRSQAGREAARLGLFSRLRG